MEMPFRIATASRRMKPEVIIIGAQKAGTTSLYHWLQQHPQMEASCRKEVHFFDGGLATRHDSYQRGELWYRAHFPVKTKKHATSVAFEASPMYLFHPLCAERIKSHYPEAKLIVLLRDPVERAISHYWHVRRSRGEKLPLLEALKAEEGRLEPIWKHQCYNTRAFKDWTYKARGLYAKQLRVYFEHFPRSQFMILQSETLFANPSAGLRQVLAFIGVNSEFTPRDISPRNIGRKKPAQLEAYDYLNKFYRNANKDLFGLMNKEFCWQTSERDR